jgi:ABC-type Fe3+ transport system substrate-binding protein
MSPEARAFLDFVISPEGQEVIANMGYFPLGRLPEMVNHLPKREGK